MKIFKFDYRIKNIHNLISRDIILYLNFTIMKKLLVLFFASSMLVSCYSVSYYSGDMTKDTPAVKVKNVKNHGFIAGLVQTKSSKIESSKYMEGKKDFKVKHC